MVEIIRYPKITTLYSRDSETFGVIPGEFRKEEFRLVRTWLVTEKIDGTNIRVILHPNGDIDLRGRTERSEIPNSLTGKFLTTFTEDVMYGTFNKNPDTGLYPTIVLFMEGYGERIQKGGGNYRKGVSFRIFDIWIDGWWLQYQSVVSIAKSLDVNMAPYITTITDWLPTDRGELEDVAGYSIVAKEDKAHVGVVPEGIVARTDPILCDRRGHRIMWKLKFRDFK
jgi:hypothetical protein